MAIEDRYNIRPASEDPLGDPADQLGETQQTGWAPDQGLPEGVRPASEDPYGDPALQEWASQNGAGPWTDQQATEYYDRFASHPACYGPQCDALQQLPPEEFQSSAQQAAYQMPTPQREAIAGDLLGALQGRGFNLGQLAQMLGFGAASSQNIQPNDFARLLGWAQQNQPDALGQAVQDKPWFIKQLGNPILQNILRNLAGRFLNR